MLSNAWNFAFGFCITIYRFEGSTKEQAAGLFSRFLSVTPSITSNPSIQSIRWIAVILLRPVSCPPVSV